jgi:hypothetical protein
VRNIARSSNGRTRPSGGRYLGSSPSLAAKDFRVLINTWKKINLILGLNRLDLCDGNPSVGKAGF